MSGFRGPAPRCDMLVLLGLQGLVVLMPLALGGVRTPSQVVGCAVVATLLPLWFYKAAYLGTSCGIRGVSTPILALLAFSALAMVQSVPLPPEVIAAISPQAYGLFTELLPGWPEGGGWSAWRPLALEPFAVQASLLAFAAPFGVFALVAGYPWGEGSQDRESRRLVFGRLVATLLVSAALIAATALLQRSLGGIQPLSFLGQAWGSDPYAHRVHGPYVNPNHLAGYLEMLIPLGALYLVSLGSHLRRRLEYRTDAARHSAIPRHRSWAAALAGAQRRLIAPLVALVALGGMLLAHQATDSRGGRVALGVGALICVVGLVRRRPPEPEKATARRAAAAAIGALALGAALVGQLMLDSAEEAAAGRSVEPGLDSRLAVVAQASPLLRDFSLVGVGLGSWMNAFRVHQAPPIEAGRWAYAHNDYLQLAVETGIVGVLILLWFTWGVVRAAGRSTAGPTEPRSGAGELVPAGGRAPSRAGEHASERTDWTAAMRDWRLLRIGLTAGALALLVHGLSDFNLRIPANVMVFMTVLGLLVLSGKAAGECGHRSPWAPVALLGVIAFAAAGTVLGAAPFRVGGAVSAWERIDEADVLFASEGEEGREEAIALARSAVELAPLEADAHELLGRILGDPAAGEAFHRRAIRLSPDEALLRDLLALRLWERGERSAALLEFEESVVHAPYLAVHHYLAAGRGLDPTSPRAQLGALAAGDSLPARLRLLDPDIRGAIERGLRRALDEGQFVHLDAVVTDLATLLEASDRHGEAAAVLERWAGRLLRHESSSRRAAADYLEAGEFEAAERVLTRQLTRTPENGELYRLLAVEVYAAQSDFDTADLVLTAGKRNSDDLLPIYRAMREVLTLQQFRGRTQRVPVGSEAEIPAQADTPSQQTVGDTIAARGELS